MCVAANFTIFVHYCINMPKSSLIINFLQTPRLLFRVVKYISTQQKFIKENIDPLINNARKLNDGSLDEAACKKLTTYYGLAVPAVLGEAFCALRGQKMSATERLASTCQGATTGLFDDFFDKQNFTGEGLKQFIEDPTQAKANNASQQLFLQLYTTGLQNMPDQKYTLSYVYRVYQAQIESKKQAVPGLSFEEIKAITLLKGAVSLLLYRTAFSPPMDKAEEDMLYQLGGLMQLCNDIFDVYDDCQDGIFTLITSAKKISEIRAIFLEFMKEGYAAAFRSNYSPANIKKFLNIISIGIFSRTLVCLDQLEANEKRSENVFTPRSYLRKDLICDMDTAKNKWRSLMYHIKAKK